MYTLTGRGVGVLAAGLVLAGLGFGLGYRELVPLGAAAVVGVGFGLAWVAAPLPVAANRTVVPDRVIRGEECRAVVDIQRASRRLARSGRAVTLTERVTGPSGETELTVPVRLRGTAATRSAYQLPTDRRGVLTVGPLRVGRRDPLGLCATQRQLAPPAQVLVRPRWQRLAAFPLGRIPTLDGVLDAAQHGSITFHALREYRFGDELRRIHWRSSARLDTLMVREHVDTAQPRLAVLVDDRAEAYATDHDAIEQVVEAAASVLVVAARDRLPVALQAASGAAATTSVEAGLDLLARVVPVAGADLAASLHGLHNTYAGDTLVVLTGPTADLRPALATREAYATLVIGVLGSHAPTPSLPDGATSITATTAEEFAERWNRIVA